MDSDPPQTRREKDIVCFVQSRLDRYLEETDQFVVECERLFCDLNNLLYEQTVGEVVSDSAIRTAIARVETCLDHLLNGYDQLRRVKPDFPYARGWSNLRDTYRKTLLDIREMLDNEEEFFADPVAYNRNRGLPTAEPIMHTVDLNFSLITPKEIEAIDVWASVVAKAQKRGPPWLRVAGFVLALPLVWWLWISELGVYVVACVAVSMIIAWLWGKVSP